MTCGKFAGDRKTLWLRGLIIALNIAALSFLVNALSLQNRYYTDGFGSVADGLPLAPVGWSLLWTTIALIINFAGTTYHPGIDIPMEFIAWGLVVGTVWLLFYWVAIIGSYNSSSCYLPGSGEKCSEIQARTGANLLLASEIIAAIAIVVSGILHFVLFVEACRGTHHRRLAEQKNRLTIVELEERVKTLEEQVKTASA